MLKNVRRQVSAILLTWCWEFWSCLNIMPESSIFTLMSTMAMELRKPFILLTVAYIASSSVSRPKKSHGAVFILFQIHTLSKMDTPDGILEVMWLWPKC